MAMFVLVVDTSIMNVSISAVVEDLGTTVSGVQSAIALEALVSAAFILIGSKVGDLIGRKRAYVLGLCGYAVGALAMTLAQGLTAIIIFWAVVGGIGASLLLPAMQSLIHGNFEGAAQKKVYAHGRARRRRSPPRSDRCSAASSPRSCRGGSRSASRSSSSRSCCPGSGCVQDVPYTGPAAGRPGRRRSCPPSAWAGWCSASWCGRRAASRSARCSLLGAAALAGLVYWLRRRKREGKATLLDPDLFRSTLFRFGVSGQMLQQIALGGTMIVLPIYLQMVLEYNAMQAGLSLAPLSLTMFARGAAGREEGRRPAPGRRSSGWGSSLLTAGLVVLLPSCRGPRPAGSW